MHCNDMSCHSMSLLAGLLNWVKDVSVLKWFGNSFYSLAAEYLKDFKPYLVVLTAGIYANFRSLKEYFVSLMFIRSWRYIIFMTDYSKSLYCHGS